VFCEMKLDGEEECDRKGEGFVRCCRRRVNFSQNEEPVKASVKNRSRWKLSVTIAVKDDRQLCD